MIRFLVNDAQIEAHIALLNIDEVGRFRQFNSMSKGNYLPPICETDVTWVGLDAIVERIMSGGNYYFQVVTEIRDSVATVREACKIAPYVHNVTFASAEYPNRVNQGTRGVMRREELRSALKAYLYATQAVADIVSIQASSDTVGLSYVQFQAYAYA